MTNTLKEGVQTMDPTDIDSPLYRVHKYLAAIQVLIPGHAIIDSVAGMALTTADLAAVLGAFSEGQWIPVAERKPQDSHEVLMYVVDARDRLPPTKETGYWNGMAWFCSSGMLSAPLKVTHWAELPGAPK